ncbi:hypothetical protein OG381_00275 [Streptomyces sp. NBC_00490]|uniref:hypothetical protein n=1 Tax=Streptomyces sp. NBC_00490 TaxID=2903657 RepID=UPI002E19BA0E
MTRATRRKTGRSGVRARTYATVLLVTGSLALAGCSESPAKDDAAKEPASPSSAAASTSTSPDAQTKAEDEVRTAYSALWGEQVKAYAQADIKGTDLKKYATKDALAQAMGDVLVMQKAGTATKGAPVNDVTDVTVTLTGKTPTATLRDCLDISNWRTVKKKTGAVKPFPTNQPLRYVTTATAEKWGTQWMITELTPDGSSTC